MRFSWLKLNPEITITPNNRDVVINNKTICNMKFIAKILSKYLIFIKAGLVQLGFTVNDLLLWHGIISAIPGALRQRAAPVRSKQPLMIIVIGYILPIYKCDSKTFRKKISSKYIIPPKSKLFFQQILDITELE